SGWCSPLLRASLACQVVLERRSATYPTVPCFLFAQDEGSDSPSACHVLRQRPRSGYPRKTPYGIPHRKDASNSKEGVRDPLWEGRSTKPCCHAARLSQPCMRRREWSIFEAIPP